MMCTMGSLKSEITKVSSLLDTKPVAQLLFSTFLFSNIPGCNFLLILAIIRDIFVTCYTVNVYISKNSEIKVNQIVADATILF